MKGLFNLVGNALNGVLDGMDDVSDNLFDLVDDVLHYGLDLVDDRLVLNCSDGRCGDSRPADDRGISLSLDTQRFDRASGLRQRSDKQGRGLRH